MAEYLYGSAVYNFGTAAPAEAPVFPEAPAKEPVPQVVPIPREGELVRTGVTTETRSRVQVSLFVLIFIPVLLACAVLLLGSYMRLNTLSNESASMAKELQELKTDHNRLEIKYESTFDLAEVETYAKSALGMVKAGADQTTFVRSTEGDKAQILGRQGFLANWERKLDGFARRIQAYFR